MKMKKFFLIAVFLAIVFVSMNLISAQVCYIDTDTNCVGNGHNVVMGLSDSDNAHGELESQTNYNYAVCCDFGGGDTSCTGANKVLGLSSQTNAHAERPGNTNYAYDVCYDSLANCWAADSATPGVGEIEVVSLSSATNAHLGNYNFNVICERLAAGGEGGICGDGTLDEGEECDSGIGTNTCSDFDAFTGGSLSCNSDCTLNTTQCTGGTGAGVCGDGVVNTGETCDGSDWGQISGCSDLGFYSGDLSCDTSSCSFNTTSCISTGTPSTCELTQGYWSLDNREPITADQIPVFDQEEVDLILEGNSCGGVGINYNIYEDDDANVIESILGLFDSATWKATYINDGIGQGLPEFYFNASVEGESSKFVVGELPMLNVSEKTIEDYCSPVSLCGDYYTDEDGVTTAEASCNVDRCDVAGSDPNIDPDADDYDCEWNTATNVCEFVNIYDSTDIGGPVGKCTYTYEDTGDTCEDDGFLEVSFTTIWTGDAANRPASCPVSGSESYECPAQIPLPFFNIFNFLVAGLIIAAIYARMYMKKS